MLLLASRSKNIHSKKPVWKHVPSKATDSFSNHWAYQWVAQLLCLAPPKCHLTFNGLHGVIYQETELFIIIAERTSNPVSFKFTNHVKLSSKENSLSPLSYCILVLQLYQYYYNGFILFLCKVYHLSTLNLLTVTSKFCSHNISYSYMMRRHIYVYGLCPHQTSRFSSSTGAVKLKAKVNFCMTTMLFFHILPTCIQTAY
jgi:hypothetical protein